MIPYFTPRERRIAKLMAMGIENREIARRVENSWLSVKNVARVVYEKSGATSRLEFAMWYWHHFPEELETTLSPATVRSHDERLA
jgi:DNA-binding NarL/FixJ family response regulator